MKTTQVHRYIHELAPETAQRDGAVNTRKDGKPSRPARGERCGVLVAKVVDDNHYAIGVSLAHPGKIKKHRGETCLVGFDLFEPEVGLELALNNIATGAALPRVCVMPATTHRARNIQKQYDEFALQAIKIFKDKQRRSASPS